MARDLGSLHKILNLNLIIANISKYIYIIQFFYWVTAIKELHKLSLISRNYIFIFFPTNIKSTNDTITFIYFFLSDKYTLTFTLYLSSRQILLLSLVWLLLNKVSICIALVKRINITYVLSFMHYYQDDTLKCSNAHKNVEHEIVLSQLA